MSKEILKKIWSERNPQHEANSDTGEDMFFDTVMMVIKDYNAVNKNFIKPDVMGSYIDEGCEHCGVYKCAGSCLEDDM